MTTLALGSALSLRRDRRRRTRADAGVGGDVGWEAMTASGGLGRRGASLATAARLPSSRDVVALVWDLDGLAPR